jgi:hypothetical protein
MTSRSKAGGWIRLVATQDVLLAIVEGAHVEGEELRCANLYLVPALEGRDIMQKVSSLRRAAIQKLLSRRGLKVSSGVMEGLVSSTPTYLSWLGEGSVVGGGVCDATATKVTATQGIWRGIFFQGK